MISRRALFGLSVGAAATVVLPTESPAQYGARLAAETDVIVGMDFGRPAALVIGPAAAYYDFRKAELISFREKYRV